MQPAGYTHPRTRDLKGGVFLLGIANIDYDTKTTKFSTLYYHGYYDAYVATQYIQKYATYVQCNIAV